ncbi:hypothetical protein AN958_01671, partial [Leucoagaricus sp. SymC.cos]
GVKTLAKAVLLNIAVAHNTIIEAQVFQTHQANKCQDAKHNIRPGSLVFLSTKNLNMPKDRARKLCPKFIGPYEVIESNPEMSNYKLDLLQVLAN